MDLERIKPHFPWITLVTLTVLVGIANPSFFSPAGLILLMADIVPLFIMALGMTFAIYIGGIDLSVQQLANMVTVIATVYLAQFGIGVALIALVAGGLFGMVSGFVTTRLYVPSFVSTLSLGFRRALDRQMALGPAGALHGRDAQGREFRLDVRQHGRRSA